jgi:tetratricopeptide (TPR) repeat protein
VRLRRWVHARYLVAAVSTPAVPRADLLDVEIPKSVWSRSGRPLQGRLTRIMFATTFVLAGLAMPWPTVAYALVIIGVLGFVLVPVITDLLIARREPAIRAATKETAQRMLDQLDKSVLVSAFAPDAWVTLQRGRLHLAKGDGRAAAQAFADTARIVRDPTMPVLRSAQARAWMLAGERVSAREQLAALEEAGALSARDHLDLGVVMLGETARAEQARTHLQAAHEGLHGHPQAAAALAVALARADEHEQALELVAKAEAEADEGDALAQDLIKRARKALRSVKKQRRKG